MSIAPITSDEMYLMFGDCIPTEVIEMIWIGPAEMTIGQVRARLREIAAERRDMPQGGAAARGSLE